MTTSIDLKPLIDILFTFAGALAPVLATWLAYRLADLLKIKSQEAVRPRVQQAIESALALMKTHVPGSLNVDVKDERVAAGARYVMAQVPDALKTLGVSPEQVAGKLTAEVAKAEQKPTPTATVDVNVETKPPT